MPLFLLLSCLLLAACGGPADQRVIEWREADRLFLADGRNGIVRVFDTRNGPVPYGQLRARERNSVRDMGLDAARLRLWVLGDDALYLYDARLLMLLERRELSPEPGGWQALEVVETGVALVSAKRRMHVPARDG